MQNVDSNFLTCIYSPSKYEELTGTIVLNNSVSMPIDLANIVEGTTTIVWDSTDGKKDITFGVSVCSELEITIFTELDRYALEKAVITLNHRVFDKQPEYENGVITNGAIYSDCPLGVFTALNVTIDRQKAHILAYDNIKKLDESCGTNVFGGTPKEILDKVCQLSGLTLGMTAEEVAAFPNGSTAVLQFDVTTGAKTYRDIVRYLGQLLGACFRVNRTTGELEAFAYSTQSDATVAPRQRKSNKPADYKCEYKGVQVTSAKGTYKSISNNLSGTVMIIDDAPAWDYGTDLALKSYVVNLGNYVRNISYTPCKLDIFNNPMFDCGDMLTVEVDNVPSHNIEMLVTSVSWKFRNTVTIEGIGSNSNDISSAGTDRQSSRTVDPDKLVSYDVTNNDAITLAAGQTATLCEVSFTSAQATHAMWLANILLNSEANDTYTDVKVSYYYDNIELEFQPQEHYVDGDHTYSLFFPISSVSEQSVHRWRVDITAIDGTVVIDENDFRGTLFGQNLVESEAMWDGILTLEDIIDYVTPITIVDNLTEGTTKVVLFSPYDPEHPDPEEHYLYRRAIADSIAYVNQVNQLQNTTETCTIKV